MKSELMCVLCPNSCHIGIVYDEKKNIQKIEGNKCKRGYDFAAQEILCPVRTLTFNINVENGDLPFVSAKTEKPVSLSNIEKLCDVLRYINISAPVKCGDILYENSDCKIIATRNIVRLE